MGFENDRLDMVDGVDMETLTPPSIDQKCGICLKLLHQKSPWCSHRIVRSNDMPVAGVLPCSHVFHADCLEHVTPKTQMHEPPCPLCLKGLESASSFSEPLQMALRSLSGEGGSRKGSQGTRRIGRLSIKNQLKRHLSYLRKVSQVLLIQS